MEEKNGEWIMNGLAEDDPRRLRTPGQLLEVVNRVGFLPLFCNGIPGFSVEEMTFGSHWWTGREDCDPWEWRRLLAESGQVAYGKFFEKKAGFVSLDWLPVFVSLRRDGYDFDALWDDSQATWRQKKIMDRFSEKEEWFSFDLKRQAGFGPGGEKNFEGVITDLMMRTYVVIRDFRCRLNREGKPYGWHVAVYATPESLWGYDRVTSAYGEGTANCRQRIADHIKEQFPLATEGQIRKILK